MFKMTFDVTLAKGYLASISRNGHLWFSRLCEDEYIRDCRYAIVRPDEVNDYIEVFPFIGCQNWRCQPDEFRIYLVNENENGVIIPVPWIKELADKRDLYGQYIPYYDAEEKMIRLKLKERVKRYGR